MSIDEMRGRLVEVRDEVEQLLAEDTLTDEQEARYTELTDEFETLNTTIATQEARAAKLDEIRAAADRGPTAVEDGTRKAPYVNAGLSRTDPYNTDDLRLNTPASELRARAESAVEKTVGDLGDAERQSAIEVLRGIKDPGGVLARRILATGTPAFRSAFQKRSTGYADLMDADERQAVVRAQSLTGGEGGFAIPFTLDPTIIYTGDGAANPFRGVCRVEQIVTDQWNGVSSAGVTGGYAAEASEVGDDAATLVQPSIDVERWDVFVPFSFEVGQDWANIESDLRMLVMERRDEFDTTAFTTGSGTNEPTGITTALDGTASEIAPTTAETFAPVADLYKTANALPPRYRRTADQAKWMGHFGTANEIRQADLGGVTDVWVQLQGGTPPRLIGFEWYENSALDDTPSINAAATADNFVMILGDWRNYVIVDRVGMNWELVPHLFATANNRPSGQRGFLAWGRTGADSVNDNAFAMLSIPTTA